MNEIKIQPNNKNINIDGSSIKKNKQVINKSTHEKSDMKKYTWDEALIQNVFPKSGITLRNVKRVFLEILGITPINVYVETTPGMYKSLYVKAKYHGEDLLYSRRETESRAAGQTILYSKHGKVQIIKLLGEDRTLSNEELKNKILQTLRIPIDLAEIMIQPNNQATIDKFEDREEAAPVIAPPKPGTKEKDPPKRRRVGNPSVDPKPKASLKETEQDDILKKIVQRFKLIRHGEAA